MKSTEAVESLAALAQETRLAIYRLLVESGPEGLAAGVIAERLGVTPATLSFHLKELAQAQLVSSERQGRSLLYRAAFAQMNTLLGYLTANCCQGAPCAASTAARCG